MLAVLGWWLCKAHVESALRPQKRKQVQRGYVTHPWLLASCFKIFSEAAWNFKKKDSNQSQVLTSKHGLSFSKGTKILGKRASGLMITLEDQSRVCQEILLKGVEPPKKTSESFPSPVQKYLQRNGEVTNGFTGYMPPSKPQPKVLKAPVAPKTPAKPVEQKRSWLRMSQKVWSTNTAMPSGVAQLADLATTMSQIMTTLASEHIQQQLDGILDLGDRQQQLEVSGPGREVNIVQAIIDMSKLLVRLCRPILQKRGYGDGGLKAFSSFFAVIEENSSLEHVSKLLGGNEGALLCWEQHCGQVFHIYVWCLLHTSKKFVKKNPLRLPHYTQPDLADITGRAETISSHLHRFRNFVPNLRPPRLFPVCPLDGP